jgi:hypothetical protein
MGFLPDSFIFFFHLLRYYILTPSFPISSSLPQNHSASPTFCQDAVPSVPAPCVVCIDVLPSTAALPWVKPVSSCWHVNVLWTVAIFWPILVWMLATPPTPPIPPSAIPPSPISPTRAFSKEKKDNDDDDHNDDLVGPSCCCCCYL